MITIRRSGDRGRANYGWLDSRHTFSFADYHDSNHMGFGVLRVINEDTIAPATGFDTHGHREMEIVSYAISGQIEHADSMGNKTVIKAGEVQRMSAGTGVMHSEYNHSHDKPAHFLQIWILPENKGVIPSYSQKDFSSHLATGEMILVASKDGRENSVTINQDMALFALKSEKVGEKKQSLNENRKGWVQVVNGKLKLNDLYLGPGDGAAIESENEVMFNWTAGSEFLFFDLP